MKVGSQLLPLATYKVSYADHDDDMQLSKLPLDTKEMTGTHRPSPRKPTRAESSNTAPDEADLHCLAAIQTP